jgi:UDP-N-acetylglucosamine 1-carboxyvinyltransferase
MDCLIIEGKQRLNGSITVGGAKNAALPILFASVLTSQKCVFENVPDLLDISTTVKLLAQMGVKVLHEPANHFVEIEAKTLSSFEAPYDLVRTMRASILILGPTLARYKKARVSLPGGCSIGARPVNLHLTGLEKMGAVISIEGGYINAETPNGKRLKGAEIFFEQVSVGATENLMMAAALADGRTVLRNAAREPEIVDLADVLIKMGAKISGAGTTEITIDGVEQLGGVKHSIISDRIEAGTYLMAAAITGGDVNLPNVSPFLLQAVLDKLMECGLEVSSAKNSIRLNASRKNFQAKDIMTLPFPGFPTDMQAQYMALMTVAEGTSIITENIFENRFMHVSELSRLGADIKVQGNVAIVKGLNGKLSGAAVMATDLRASACLVLAGLAAEGKTKVRRIYHLDRGYEKMEVKLAAIGAKISREKEDA